MHPDKFLRHIIILSHDFPSRFFSGICKSGLGMENNTLIEQKHHQHDL